MKDLIRWGVKPMTLSYLELSTLLNKACLWSTKRLYYATLKKAFTRLLKRYRLYSEISPWNTFRRKMVIDRWFYLNHLKEQNSFRLQLIHVVFVNSLFIIQKKRYIDPAWLYLSDFQKETLKDIFVFLKFDITFFFHSYLKSLFRLV